MCGLSASIQMRAPDLLSIRMTRERKVGFKFQGNIPRSEIDLAWIRMAILSLCFCTLEVETC